MVRFQIFIACLGGCLLSYVSHAQSNTHLKILKVEYTDWNVAAAPQDGKAGGGRIYEIEIEIKRGGTAIKIDSVIVASEMFPAELVVEGQRNYNGMFHRGDTVKVIARKDKGVNGVMHKPGKYPYNSLIYKSKGKRRWIAFSEYTRKEAQVKIN